MEETNKELYEVVLDALREQTDDPSEIASALAQALTIILQATQDLTGQKEEVKNTAKSTFDQILNLL